MTLMPPVSYSILVLSMKTGLSLIRYMIPAFLEMSVGGTPP